MLRNDIAATEGVGGGRPGALKIEIIFYEIVFKFERMYFLFLNIIKFGK